MEEKTKDLKNNKENIKSKNYKKSYKKDFKSEEKVVKTKKTTEKTQTKKVTKKEDNKVKTNKFEKKNKSIFKSSKLKVIALGGLDEIGKNITLYEYEDEMVLVDCGLEFPEDDMLGVDLVIPDFSYLINNKDKIKGLFVTHGHEDHIGSIPYLLREVNVPIYATKLTCKLIKHKLEEHHLISNAKLNIVEQGDIINVGKFSVEFIRSSHSIPDACMLAITSPAGVVLHTGDFKVDFTPIDGQMIDLGRIAELGNKGILAMLADSTNAERKGFTMSEKSVGPVFDELFEGCKKNCCCNIRFKCS